MRPLTPLIAGTLALALAAAPRSAESQIVTGPVLHVPAGGGAASFVSVASTYAGIFAANGGQRFEVRQYQGGQWSAPSTANVTGPSGDVVLAASLDGSFIAAWFDVDEVYLRSLDVVGAPLGTPLQVSSNEAFRAGTLRAAGVATGGALVWAESGPAGFPFRMRIGARLVEVASGASDFDVATTPSGGCVIGWHVSNVAVGTLAARVFDAVGEPITGALPLPFDELTVGGIAMNPSGDTIALVGLRSTSDPTVYEVRALRFDLAGAAVGPEILVAITARDSSQVRDVVLPDVEYDFAGNLYVAWADVAGTAPGVYARAYDAAGTPLGASVSIADHAVARGVRVARGPDGTFANTWVAAGAAWIATASLCAPGTSTCGDGVLQPACERCDDGPANDDAVPDACRTNCLLPHCGDGAVDAAEDCDDGNFYRCDGCGPDCRLEPGFACGDGVLSTMCREQCDDGNAATLDGCTAQCRIERIPGGGPAVTDCLGEWSIDNPTNVTPRDRYGNIVNRQICTDDDPRCDFDGGTPGSCTFHLRMCANNTGVPGCSPPSRLADWQLDRPSARDATKRPHLAAIRAAMLGAVPGAILGPSDRDVCSAEMAVTVPLRGRVGAPSSGKVMIKTRATSYEGAVDKDKLTLECRPAQ